MALRCLVTGAAGFIGSHLTERLLDEGYEVTGIDCFTPYYSRTMKMSNLSLLRPRDHFTFLEEDLLTADLTQLLGGMDYVFHLSAQPGVRASWGRCFDTYVRNNIVATQRLLEAAKNVELKRFIYASSSSVYGESNRFPMTETITPHPVSPYGVTKLAGEHLCHLYRQNFGIPIVALRFFTVFGPRQRPDMAFHRFIAAAMSHKEIVVYGDGQQIRDFTFVRDVVHATVLAMEADAVGETLNIGGCSQITIRETIDLIGRLLGCTLRVRYAKGQSGDVTHTGADITKARRFLGYEPKTDIEAGLRAEVEWLMTLKGAEE